MCIRDRYGAWKTFQSKQWSSLWIVAAQCRWVLSWMKTIPLDNKLHCLFNIEAGAGEASDNSPPSLLSHLLAYKLSKEHPYGPKAQLPSHSMCWVFVRIFLVFLETENDVQQFPWLELDFWSIMGDHVSSPVKNLPLSVSYCASSFNPCVPQVEFEVSIWHSFFCIQDDPKNLMK